MDAGVSNLNIKKSCIKAFNTVGSFIGAAMNKCKISNCYNYATVTGKRNNVGGIAGVSAEDNIFLNCSNYRKVSGMHSIEQAELLAHSGERSCLQLL